MMKVESYRGYDIYWEFIEGTNGFGDNNVFISDASRFGRDSIEEVKKDIDKMFIL